ncbi:MAG: TonB-dependent receptor [Bacteroidota bacterium]|jgi:outer membrane receptor protein involved in Fe transport
MQQKYWLTLLLLFLVPGVMFAQSGKIRGSVVDAKTKEPLIGANIVLEGTSSGSATDIQGTFILLNIPVGTYSIKATYIGYRSMTISNVRVNSQLTTEANFTLSSEDVQVQAVEVIAERPLINKSATNAISIVDNENIQQMPVRNLTSVFSLQAGVVQQGVDVNGNANIYIRGSRADESGYQVDGVSINNVYAGGRAVAINQEAVEQIQVQSGGYPAEFGGANGGLINMQLKTGREQLHATLQAETDNYTSQGTKSLGGYSYGYSDYVATLSGPIVSNKVRFFASVENQFYRDWNVRYWDGFNFTGSNAAITAPEITAAHAVSLPDTLNLAYQAGNLMGSLQNDYTYTGSLLFDLDEFQLRGSGSYHTRDARNAAGFANVLNASRTAVRQNYDGFSNIKATAFLSPKTYIEANLNYFASDLKTMDPYFKDNFGLYADSVANAQYGFIMKSPGNNYLPWKIGGGGQTVDASVNMPGTPTTGYAHTSQQSMGGRVDLVSQAGNHAIKLGGEYSYYTIRRYTISGGPNDNTGINALFSQGYLADTTDVQRQVSLMSGGYVDNIGYDALGNSINGDQNVNGNLFNLGPRHPQFGGAYIQDKIELSDIVLNIGVRYDYINSDNIQYKDPTNLHVISLLGVVSNNDIVKAPTTSQISPRFGFGFPVTDKTMFHAQYGKFIQQSELSDTYSGLGQATYYISGGNFIQFPLGYGLRPERSTQYEAGFSQQIADNASFDITFFYKDVEDAIQYASIIPSAGATIKSYPALINGDFSTAKGLEFKFTLRRVKRVQMQLNYTYTNGQGTGSNSSDLAGAAYNGYIPKMIFPFSYNQAHTGNLSLDYRFGQNDGGPILQQFGVNLLFTFGSGYNYTQENSSGNLYSSAETDVRGRIPVENIGGSTTRATYELDLRIDKTVSLGSVNANFYIYVINLLNTQNVVSVFSTTGDPTDDGWLASAAGQQEALGAVNPAQYNAIYQARYLGNNVSTDQRGALIGNGPNGSNYGAPRQIRFGMKLEF